MLLYCYEFLLVGIVWINHVFLINFVYKTEVFNFMFKVHGS